MNIIASFIISSFFFIIIPLFFIIYDTKKILIKKININKIKFICHETKKTLYSIDKFNNIDVGDVVKLKKIMTLRDIGYFNTTKIFNLIKTNDIYGILNERNIANRLYFTCDYKSAELERQWVVVDFIKFDYYDNHYSVLIKNSMNNYGIIPVWYDFLKKNKKKIKIKKEKEYFVYL